MRRIRFTTAWLFVSMLTALSCRAGFEAAPRSDGGDPDDAGSFDAGLVDVPDADARDASLRDGSLMDAPSIDDGGVVDGGVADTGVADGGGGDASGADGGTDGGTPPPPPQVLSAGCEHTCAVVADGSVWCWGRNQFGQLGDGTMTSSSTPLAVPGLAGAVTVTTGCGHTCAVLDDGSVRCWGRNDMAALGIGTLMDSPTPVDVPGLAGATALGAGYHTCARFPDGTLRCAGWNLYGQCGDRSTTTRRMPVDVVEGCCGLPVATALTTGLYHNCVLSSVGPPMCWGGNTEGQLGDGTTVNRTTPVPVTGLTGATALAAGRFHTCAVIGGGSVRCWGQNFGGQLGDGTRTRSTAPVSVMGLAGAAIAVAAGGNHSCAIIADGSVQCWGGNSFGQIGVDETRSYTAPTPVTVPGISNATFLTSQADHTCALVADGSIRCWGANTHGQIGNGTTDDAMVPVTVLGLP